MQRVFLYRLHRRLALGLMMIFAAGGRAWPEHFRQRQRNRNRSEWCAGTGRDRWRLSNPVSGYSRTAVTDSSGSFHFSNLPFDQYTLTVSNPSFATPRKQVSHRVLHRCRCRFPCASAGGRCSLVHHGREHARYGGAEPDVSHRRRPLGD